MHIPSGKELWDALEAKFRVFDAGSELYVMEHFYDYKMVDDHSVVEQAHELQALGKELHNFKCNPSEKFVAGGIIAKLPPSWRNFATSLKHKTQEFTVVGLIGTLDAEEKARAKDRRAHGNEGGSSAHVVQKKNFQCHKNKGKGKIDSKHKATQTTTFKKKKKIMGKCFVCGVLIIGLETARTARISNSKGKKKSANVIIGDIEKGTSGYGTGSMLMGNGSNAAVHCVGTFNLKFTS